MHVSPHTTQYKHTNTYKRRKINKNKHKKMTGKTFPSGYLNNLLNNLNEDGTMNDVLQRVHNEIRNASLNVSNQTIRPALNALIKLTSCEVYATDLVLGSQRDILWYPKQNIVSGNQLNQSLLGGLLAYGPEPQIDVLEIFKGVAANKDTNPCLFIFYFLYFFCIFLYCLHVLANGTYLCCVTFFCVLFAFFFHTHKHTQNQNNSGNTKCL